MTPSFKLAFAACAVLVAAPHAPASATPRKHAARYMVLSPARPVPAPVARTDAQSSGNAAAAMRWQDGHRGENP